VLATPGSGRPGVISNRNQSNDTTTTSPKNTGYAAVPKFLAASGMSVDATSATSVAGRRPRLCSELESSRLANPTTSEASTTVQFRPCVKQTIAITATAAAVRMAVGRSRAGATFPESDPVRSRVGALAPDAGPWLCGPRAGARRFAARSRANDSSSSTGPSFESAPSFWCSPRQLSAKSDAANPIPRPENAAARR
jgi:hypothetical protein